MNIVLILVLTALMDALRSFSAGEVGNGGGVSLALGYLLLTAYFVGGTFNLVRLPKLTGYIVTGIVAGPYVLDLLSEQVLGSLKIVNGVAVALIAMTAGSELEYRALRPLLRSIWGITLFGVIGTTLLLTLTVYLMRDTLPFFAAMTLGQSLAVSLVLGVVMVAQSPAVVVALRDEMQADGPVARTVLGVVVIADLVVILMFALSSAAAKALFGASADMLATLLTLTWELGGSLVVGAGIGYVLGLYLRKVKSGAALFLLIVAFIIAEVGQRIHLDPLLVALAAGMLVRNTTTVGEELHAHIEWSALPVYILFFAVTGANIHLDVLAVVGLPALVFVGARGLGLFFGSCLGARFAEASPSVQRYAGFGLLPQAGLALALALLFTKTFPEFGAEAGALTLGVVAINELIAPALYRAALVRAGEAGQRASASSRTAERAEAPPSEAPPSETPAPSAT
jgi:Kef-type K+ transport system membrane component KefB